VGVGVVVWLGDGVADRDGLTVGGGLVGRGGGVDEGVPTGTAGVGPGFPVEPVWAVPAETGRTWM
jgi:hypothetical protein